MDTLKTDSGNTYVTTHPHDMYADKHHRHHHEYAEHDHEHDEYLEHHDMHEYPKKSECASKATANTALGLGIAGTAGAIWNAWKEHNDRRYGKYRRDYDDDCDYDYGRRRGRGCGCGEHEFHWWHREERRERHYEIEKENELATVKAALAQQSAERFAEQGDFKNYKTLSRMIEEENEELAADVKRLAGEVCELKKCCAVAEAKAEGKFEVVKEGMKDFKEDLYSVKISAREELKAAIQLEAERRDCCCDREREARRCGDERIEEWVECNFARNKKVIPAENICPTVMPRFNAFDIDRIECECDRRERREREGRERRHRKDDKE